MKTNYLNLTILFTVLNLLICIKANAIDYVSSTSGDWGTFTNWSPNGIPGAGDKVTISVGHTIDISSQRLCRDLTVNGIINWTGGYRIVVYGDYLIAATGSETGTLGAVSLQGTGTRSITCLGTASPTVGYEFFKNYTIAAGSTFNKANTSIVMYNNNTIITNLGNVTVNTIIAAISTSGVTWINSTNSYLALIFRLQGPLTFQANATGNTVEDKYNYTTMPNPTTGFYNLILNSGANKYLPAATTIINDLTINSGTTLSAYGYDLRIGGNWINNGTFLSSNKTVTFNGTNQTIIKSGGENFYNLILAGTGTTTLASAIATNANLTINSGATLNVSTSNYAVNVKGNFTNNGTYTPQAGIFTFNGATPQTISGSSLTTFSKLTINNTTSSITLSKSIKVISLLTLTKGNIISTSANIVTINNGATASGASTLSFISGPVSKVGNTTFTFPIGKGANYQPLSISAPTTITDAYTAEYFATTQTDGVTLDATINNLSTCEYWDFNRISGSSTVSITLGWNGNSCNNVTPGLMKIANWNGAVWKDEGGINSTGTITAGTTTTTTTTVQSTFGHYTLANSAAGYVSIASGDWGTSTNWSPNGIPGASDNVTISVGHTIDISTQRLCKNLTVNGIINWTGGYRIVLYGDYLIAATGSETGTLGAVSLQGTGTRSITCLGTASPNIAYDFYTNYTIVTGSTLNKANTTITLRNNNTTITNLGNVTINSIIAQGNTSGVTWINSNNSYLTLTFRLQGPLTLQANAAGNTVEDRYNYITMPNASTGFYNLILNSGSSKYLPAPTTIANNLTINAGTTLNANGHDLTIGGNWLNNGAFVSGSSNTVTFNGINQTITNTGGAFYNLNLAGSSSKTLSSAITTTNVTINAATTLDVSASNFALNVKGNFTNNGTFSPQAGTVTLDGTAAQNIAGSSSTTFNGLAVNNNAGVNITSGTYRLDNVLTLSNGTLNTNGNTFTMTSNAAQTARIAPIAGTGAISGNFTVERYISARTYSWADFSSPVQNSTFLDWENELPSTRYSTNKNKAFAATFNEKTDEFVPVSSNTKTLSPGEGFELFLTASYDLDPIANTTINTIGVPNQGTQDFSNLLSHNNAGSHLIGNPFAANVSWASIYTASGGTSSNLYDLIDIYNYHTKDWQSYTSASNVELGSSQGFWVYTYATGPYKLIIPESAKTATSKDSILKMISPSVFTLKIADKNSPYEHTFRMVATEKGNNGLDNQDLPFRFSPNETTPALYSMVEGKKINTNVFNSLNDNYSISLKTRVGIASTYTIDADGFDYVNEFTCITLEDKALQKMIDLRAEKMYAFKMSPTDKDDRFVIHFSKNSDCNATATNTDLVSSFANDIDVINTHSGNTINFNLSEVTPTTVSFVNLLGQAITNPVVVPAYKQSIDIELPTGYTGLYLLKIESANGRIIKKFVKK